MLIVPELRSHLASLSPGPVQDTARLAHLLALAWSELSGSGAESMDGSKLVGRMEGVTWQPPILSFVIERHGGTVHGSSRAELHRWKVDLDALTAKCDAVGRRQLRPMAARIDVRPIAEEVGRAITGRQDDARLKWHPDGTVRVLVGSIFPMGSAFGQTLGGRRRRFRDALDKQMRLAGWCRVRANVYAPPTSMSP